MMKGSQNLNRRKEEIEEEEEDWEVSSQVEDEIDLKGTTIPIKANSMFLDCNYWDLREKKLKELRWRANRLNNGEAKKPKTVLNQENGKLESEKENVKDDRSIHENGKELFFQNKLNDLLSKKVVNNFYPN